MKRETQTGNSLVRYPTTEGELGQGIKRPTQKVVFGACFNLNMATMSIQGHFCSGPHFHRGRMFGG